jgi:hypothetical protein
MRTQGMNLTCTRQTDMCVGSTRPSSSMQANQGHTACLREQQDCRSRGKPRSLQHTWCPSSSSWLLNHCLHGTTAQTVTGHVCAAGCRTAVEQATCLLLSMACMMRSRTRRELHTRYKTPCTHAPMGQQGRLQVWFSTAAVLQSLRPTPSHLQPAMQQASVTAH